MALELHDDGPWDLCWAGNGDLGSDQTTFGYWGPLGKDPTKDIRPTNPPGYHLYCWHGPAEKIMGGMGPELRNMKRAQHMGWYPTEAKAREAANAFYTTGMFGTFNTGIDLKGLIAALPDSNFTPDEVAIIAKMLTDHAGAISGKQLVEEIGLALAIHRRQTKQ